MKFELKSYNLDTREMIMEHKAWMLSALLAMAMSVSLAGCSTAKKKSDGLVGNSYATLRITTRKKVSGDLNEVNKPGTSMYNALIAVQNGATARAAIEAKNLGYDVFQVLGSRNLTQVQEKRNASADLGGGLSESAFTFAQGHYTNDVELAIEVTVKLISGKMPANPPQDYVDVNEVLAQIGLADMFTDKKQAIHAPAIDRAGGGG
jgi:hypothetical protein